MIAQALQRLLAARPVLAAVRSAGEVLGLSAQELLHAGPPLRDPRRPPAVLMSSAVMTLLHAGHAASAVEAEAMVGSGEVHLASAQSRGCLVPLAFVVSSSTPLFEVPCGEATLYAPVSTVCGPDTRMGSRDPALQQRLRDRDHLVAPGWARLLRESGPVDLLPLAAHGLAQGDDLHARTTAANAALAQAMRLRGASALAGLVEATPLFFLTPWMAACAAILRSAERGDVPSLVTRAGGNGESFGIALAASPSKWQSAEGTPPRGPLSPSARGAAVCPAIGDSAVIDMLGLGAMAFDGAPEPRAALGEHLPSGHRELAAKLLVCHHGLLGCRVGMDARLVLAHGVEPLVALAMLAADGRGGLVGRGLYRPPRALFNEAVTG